MGATELDKDGFPVLPGFRARWRALYFEPIANSGERFTFAILTKAASAVQIHSVLRPSAMRNLFGPKSAGLRGFTDLVAESLRAHLAAGGTPNNWISPITGVSLGEWRDAVSDSIQGVLSQAVQLTSSLALDPRLAAESRGDDQVQDRVRKRLIEQIRDEVSNRRMELVPYFERDAVLIDRGEPVRFGFLGRSVIAHFGMLRPLDIGQSYQYARARLWELRKARKRVEVPIHARLILQVPRDDDLNFEQRHLEQAERVLGELHAEAEEDDVAVIPVHSPPEAAEQLVKIAA